MITMMVMVAAMGCNGDNFVAAIHDGFHRDFAKSEKAAWLGSGTVEMFSEDGKGKLRPTTFAAWRDPKGVINLGFDGLIGEKEKHLFEDFAGQDKIDSYEWEVWNIYYINSGAPEKGYWIKSDKAQYSWIRFEASDLNEALRILRDQKVIGKSAAK